MLRLVPWLLLAALLDAALPAVRAHDIPNQRIDRSIQVTVMPGTLRIDYEVSLSELTLTQDLRNLIGNLPGGSRPDWFARYGEVTGPLNAKGFLITCGGHAVELKVRSFDLKVEEHPRYTFHLEGGLPGPGRLAIVDTNYASSEGTSRLAVRGRDGVQVGGDDLPDDVERIEIRPVWMLSDEEERRTHRVDVTFRLTTPDPTIAHRPTSPPPATPTPARPPVTITGTLSRLLDREPGLSLPFLLALAAGLGAMHAIQPGHGKTLVSAAALGQGARWYHPVWLALITTLTHTGSVLLMAAILWWTGTSAVGPIHQSLVRVAGFAIAASGLWRLGSYLGGHDGGHAESLVGSVAPSMLGLTGLGLAGGLVPCWDAVGLVVLSAALGRLALGVMLVLSFGIGMAAVLVAVGLLASRLRSRAEAGGLSRAWESRLGLTSGLILAGIGLIFFLT